MEHAIDNIIPDYRHAAACNKTSLYSDT